MKLNGFLNTKCAWKDTSEVGCDQIKGQGICLMGAVEEDKRDKGKLESMTKTKWKKKMKQHFLPFSYS